MKQAIRKMLPRAMDRWLRERVVARRDRRDLAAYRRTPSVPPPHAVKVDTIISLGRRFGCRTLIETGTFEGETPRKCRDDFDHIYTIELGAELAARAKRELAMYPHIEVLQGDSSVRLRETLARVEEPAVLWLDGHYSGEGTARGDRDTPLLAELESVRDAGRVDDVILIDDARCLGEPGYPTLDALKSLLLEIQPNGEISVQHDCLRCTPA